MHEFDAIYTSIQHFLFLNISLSIISILFLFRLEVSWVGMRQDGFSLEMMKYKDWSLIVLVILLGNI